MQLMHYLSICSEHPSRKENESIFIPQKAIHRLTIATSLPMTLIEVQIGTYLGEDDIERLENVYGRS